LEIVGSEKSGSESDQQEEPFERAAVDGLPRLAAIERLHKKRRQTKAERLAQVHEGRQGREPFNRPKKNVRRINLLFKIYHLNYYIFNNKFIIKSSKKIN
jgi:hypothetical protein